MPRVLFIHNGVPGRFAPIARALLARGWTGALVNGPEGNDLSGIPTLRWRGQPGTALSGSPLVRRTELNLRRGRGAAEGCLRLKADGFRPDLIIGHPAWGEMLFLDDVFPDTPQIQIGEFYYQTRDSHWNFDPEFANSDFDATARFRAGNLTLAASYAAATLLVCPTLFQASMLPAVYAPRVRILHEGVDTAVARRSPAISVRLPSGAVLDGAAPVVTFVSRRFEPLRGFHTFMRALPALLSAVPEAQVLIVGSDDPEVYGPRPPQGKSWKQTMLDEVGARLDHSRVHFIDAIPYQQLLAVFSISTAHVYLTYPFVLSWSLLDAMACECLVVGSDTAPVREILTHGENGLLVDFFDPGGLATTLIEICRDRHRYAALRVNARETVVARFDQKTVCEPAWLAVVDEALASS